MSGPYPSHFGASETPSPFTNILVAMASRLDSLKSKLIRWSITVLRRDGCQSMMIESLFPTISNCVEMLVPNHEFCQR